MKKLKIGRVYKITILDHSDVYSRNGKVSVEDFASDSSPPLITFYGELVGETEVVYNFLLSYMTYVDDTREVDYGISALKTGIIEAKELK